MELPVFEILLQSLLVFMGFTVINFVSIHPMANLLIYEGSSRNKSFSISSEFALLSTVYVMLALVIANIFDLFSADASLALLPLAVVSIGYLFFVEIFRVWYLRQEYDTTWLYAFLIAEGVAIILQGAIILLRNTLLFWI